MRVAGSGSDRELGADDVEPLTWALAERAAAITADDYLEALAAVQPVPAPGAAVVAPTSPRPRGTSC